MAEQAPGWPGITPRWTSSAKSGVGTALDGRSQLWFTISHGIVNEVYYPRIDHACIRDMGLVVTGADGFLSEEKRHADHRIFRPAPGAPAYRLENRCLDGRYDIHKEILSDPMRPVLLQRTRFIPRTGRRGDYRLHVLLAPHLGNRGAGNTGWIGDYKGYPMLFAQRDGIALALASSEPWFNRSAGFVGVSDGWQDLMTNGALTWSYQQAENGNVALTGGIVLPDEDRDFLLALGFGADGAEAGQRARAALDDGIDAARSLFVQGWDGWQDSLHRLDADRPGDPMDRYRISTIVLRTHAAADFPGGVIASLSIPWGMDKGDEDLGGYHLVWPRDLVETAGGFLAAGALEGARRVLGYLQSTQEIDGHWAQNMWLDGTPYWNGVQMDETALPVIIVDLARREGALADTGIARYWPMVKAAAGYIVRNGPVSPQDRWEENAGYSPFTVAAEIVALLVAADFADDAGESSVATYLRETADAWYGCIDRWMYAGGTDIAAQCGVRGYYVRVAPVVEDEGVSRFHSSIPVCNTPHGHDSSPACDLVAPDALALVRFGLRTPDDPRILDTIGVIDRLLRVELPAGPAWHRYNGDGYGEHADGSSFDGTGTGRAWPLLTGERAHYELAAGNVAEAGRLLAAMEQFASDGGMIPEQSWDALDIAERELFFGRPAGSAMPLVWAHAEYVKLRRSLRDGAVFDLPPQPVRRYLVDGVRSDRMAWRFSHKLRTLPRGMTLRIETLAAARVRWTLDEWHTTTDSATRDSGLGVHLVDLPTARASTGTTARFTMYWPGAERWEGTDFEVRIEDGSDD